MKTESQEKISKILENYSYKPEKLIPILQKVQDEYNYLPKDVMDFIAYKLNIPSARVFGVATFFAHFAITPKGKYIIKVCDGTACHVKKSEAIINKIKDFFESSESPNLTSSILFCFIKVFNPSIVILIKFSNKSILYILIT